MELFNARPIPQDQGVVEIKRLYSDLVAVEGKCMEAVKPQNRQDDPGNMLSSAQWEPLISLHQTLLRKHRDFFLASQQPTASPALNKLPSTSGMAARMWRHGIYNFLELLKHCLPTSLGHMLSFFYLAYSTMDLLYRTVPAFKDPWMECLGDLGRYRMAIEDDNSRDREAWVSMTRHWYSEASDKAPTTGRLYHHLAILARPTPLQQLYYYTKSLCVPIPFTPARDSIMTLFDPIMEADATENSRLAPIEIAFIQVHGIMFSKNSEEKLESTMDKFVNGLDKYITCSSRGWVELGYYIGLSNCCSIVGYGNDHNPIYNAITGSEIEREARKEVADALRISNRTHDIVLRRFRDMNVLPYLHVTLAFIYHLTSYPEAMAYVAPDFPWKLTAVTLNKLLDSVQSYSRIESTRFPEHEKAKAELPRPLPEDYAMRGLLWVDKYFLDDWFSNDNINDDEKYLEVASRSEERKERKERILYLGCRIVARGGGKWLRYDLDVHEFGVSQEYDIELDL